MKLLCMHAARGALLDLSPAVSSHSNMAPLHTLTCSHALPGTAAQPGCMDLILRRRKGFVKLALQAGADLVPVIAFGENEVYKRSQLRPGSLADRMQRATKKARLVALRPAWSAFPACLVCLPARQPASTPACPHVRLPACPHSSLPAYLRTAASLVLLP